MNLYFISIFSCLYFIRPFKNVLLNTNIQKYNLTKLGDFKNTKRTHICGFDEEGYNGIGYNGKQYNGKQYNEIGYNRKQYNRSGYNGKGYDERFNHTSDLNITTVKIVALNLQKMKLLRLLEDANVSIFEKIDLINKYFPFNYSYDLFASGLRNDIHLFGLD